MSPLVYLNDYTNKRLFFTVNEYKDDYVKGEILQLFFTYDILMYNLVTVELGNAQFKGFSIRQGEETFIKAVYFALEQACLEGTAHLYILVFTHLILKFFIMRPL